MAPADASLKRYELTFENRPGYLYARVVADTVDRASGLAYLTEVAEKCAALECKRLAIVRDIPVMLPEADVYFTTQKFLAMVQGVRVAFINPHANIEKSMAFGVMVGKNRGAQFTLHKTIADAEEWLLK